MKKLLKNKGFTLVELIIVVAIIAILASVLAPQYLQYVERARQSNDLQVATNYMKAAQVAVTDLSSGTHTGDFNWYAFKWGFNGDRINMHIGVATESNGRPTGIDGQKRDALLQIKIAEIMGWSDGDDEFGEGDEALMDTPQSEVGRTQALVFFMNTRTGEILVDKNSAKWVTEIGLDAEILP